MALPAITPYPMPREDEMPANRVSWTPDARRAVLLVHDMQNHFVNAFAPGTSPIVELVSAIAELRETAREAGVPVVYSAQPGGQTSAQRGLLEDFWGAGVGAEPSAQEIIAPLAPGPDDIRLTKWRYSAFHRTPLRDLLAEHGRDQLIVTGIYAHIGCLMTACDAFMGDVEVFFVADGVADFSAEHHRMAQTYAAERCAAVLPAVRVRRLLSASAAHATR
ncbi:isochorismatase family protein [Streptosporangium sp. NPDC002721]|uniref:isochorismatase family protein n=1 Tax=Streptosporangium sp. NPDC002721 TaxID=3366188 RepID=UPI0036CBA8D3